MSAIGTADTAVFGITSVLEIRLNRRMAAIEAGNATEGNEGFREVVQRHGRMVFCLAYRITGNETDAEDVVQETFLRAFRNLARFDSRASLSTWLFRIAANCSIDVLRARKRRPESPLSARGLFASDPASHDPSPHAAARGSEIGRHLSDALSELTPQERAAFVLRHFEGQPIEEIGKALGLRANAVKQAVFRAVRKLRTRLEPLRETLR